MRSSDDQAPVLSHLDGGLLTLTLNRPERRNALDVRLRDALGAALDEAAVSAEIRAVVLTGAGGAFCAGGDLAAFDQLHDPRLYRHRAQPLSELVEAIERLEKPVVVAINGVATGVGLTLALACDWRVVSPRARLLFREGRLGLVPTHGGVTRLVKLIGLARASEALLGGEDIDADAALRLGLANQLAEDAVATAHERARSMLERAPLSFGAAKRLLHLAADVDARSAVLAESLAQSALLATDDHREGLAAVRERRQPQFSGR